LTPIRLRGEDVRAVRLVSVLEEGHVIGLTPRADRIPLSIPIAYRRVGDDHWFQSRSMNLSESGILFGPTELQPGAAVEVMMAPPIDIGSRTRGRQVCAGQVVRSTHVGAVAVRVRSCRFMLDD
jgi:hypothetical protein